MGLAFRRRVGLRFLLGIPGFLKVNKDQPLDQHFAGFPLAAVADDGNKFQNHKSRSLGHAGSRI